LFNSSLFNLKRLYEIRVHSENDRGFNGRSPWFNSGAFIKETLIKSFDKLRTNGKPLIPFVVSLSNHERNQLNQRFLNFLIGLLEQARRLLFHSSSGARDSPGIPRLVQKYGNPEISQGGLKLHIGKAWQAAHDDN